MSDLQSVSIIGFSPETSGLTLLLKKEGRVSLNTNPYLRVVRLPLNPDSETKDPQWFDHLTPESLFLKHDFFEMEKPKTFRSLDESMDAAQTIWRTYSTDPEIVEVRKGFWEDKDWSPSKFENLTNKLIDAAKKILNSPESSENQPRKERFS